MVHTAARVPVYTSAGGTAVGIMGKIVLRETNTQTYIWKKKGIAASVPVLQQQVLLLIVIGNNTAVWIKHKIVLLERDEQTH